MIRILIADDHAVVRRGLKQILDEAVGMKVTGEAATAQEVLEQAGARPHDIVVLDLTMPGSHGLDLLKTLRRDYPQLPVLVLSVHPEDQFAARVLKAGAAGYMTKETAPEELVKAVKKTVGGGRYVSPALAEKLAFALEAGMERPSHELLSDREDQVLRMIGSGKTVTEIAKELSLSPKTISAYRARILVKMRMENTAQLIHYAIRHRLVNPVNS